ncbi:N-acetylmuramoyl-L-alanine amidase [Streptomyces sporangiiformans]|uniref:N-acetylmuramoyl-L-alanine amidase n=2 Tax=Streptomyces sporangiiformans TaxID=2315329 RepID=A0A505DKA1_9ACTN|nr:N-acetylmuramoyl-L-alanine amidase [Streptomyces sporangiiformans]
MFKIDLMRGYLFSSIAVTCAAALALPLASPSGALAERPAAAGGPAIPGSTQSLPLAPLDGDRTLGPAAEQGLPQRDVRRFSLVGVVWDDPDAELHGRVQVRTRATGSSRWSGWQDIETHNREHSADLDAAERTTGRVRGSTAPLWVGDSDGVEVRVQPGPDEGAEEAEAGVRSGRTGASEPLPDGLRLELVDPGDDPPPQSLGPLTAASAASSAVNSDLAPLGATVIPALSRRQTMEALLATRGEDMADQRSQPYIGPRPQIVTRRGWRADEKLREPDFAYTKTVKAAFVHHTATGNTYRCSQASSVIRSIYRYHVKSMRWRDIGYNFLVDKCGNIYEGRAGGVTKPVMGAHTLGFNTNSMGIAVLGTFGYSRPRGAAVNAIARLTAWKLGIYGANPAGKTYLKSGGGNLYRKGKNVRLNVISGHRDGFATTCPGGRLYAKLGTARTSSARYQGR